MTTTRTRSNHGPWVAMPSRQFTGRPWIHRAYVENADTYEKTGCTHNHRRPDTAERCAGKLARLLNRLGK